MNGAADCLATAILIAIVVLLACRVFLWMADKVIDGIDWITRGEG